MSCIVLVDSHVMSISSDHIRFRTWSTRLHVTLGQKTASTPEHPQHLRFEQRKIREFRQRAERRQRGGRERAISVDARRFDHEGLDSEM